jgi:hypothetical protein
MLRALLPITVVIFLSVFVYSCSSDDDDSAASSVIQTSNTLFQIYKTNEVFQNESNLVTNHYDIDWIKFVDMNDDGIDELMIEGVNHEIQQNQYIAPSFNGWGLNENNKFIRKKY